MRVSITFLLQLDSFGCSGCNCFKNNIFQAFFLRTTFFWSFPKIFIRKKHLPDSLTRSGLFFPSGRLCTKKEKEHLQIFSKIIPVLLFQSVQPRRDSRKWIASWTVANVYSFQQSQASRSSEFSSFRAVPIRKNRQPNWPPVLREIWFCFFGDSSKPVS